MEEITEQQLPQNYYQILAIENYASTADCRKAYHKKSLECHPDKVPENATDEEKESYKERFEQLKKAYSVLSDAEKKKSYDSFLLQDLDVIELNSLFCDFSDLSKKENMDFLNSVDAMAKSYTQIYQQKVSSSTRETSDENKANPASFIADSYIKLSQFYKFAEMEISTRADRVSRGIKKEYVKNLYDSYTDVAVLVQPDNADLTGNNYKEIEDESAYHYTIYLNHGQLMVEYDGSWHGNNQKYYHQATLNLAHFRKFMPPQTDLQKIEEELEEIKSALENGQTPALDLLKDDHKNWLMALFLFNCTQNKDEEDKEQIEKDIVNEFNESFYDDQGNFNSNQIKIEFDISKKRVTYRIGVSNSQWTVTGLTIEGKVQTIALNKQMVEEASGRLYPEKPPAWIEKQILAPLEYIKYHNTLPPDNALSRNYMAEVITYLFYHSDDQQVKQNAVPAEILKSIKDYLGEMVSIGGFTDVPSVYSDLEAEFHKSANPLTEKLIRLSNKYQKKMNYVSTLPLLWAEEMIFRHTDCVIRFEQCLPSEVDSYRYIASAKIPNLSPEQLATLSAMDMFDTEKTKGTIYLKRDILNQLADHLIEVLSTPMKNQQIKSQNQPLQIKYPLIEVSDSSENEYDYEHNNYKNDDLPTSQTNGLSSLSGQGTKELSKLNEPKKLLLEYIQNRSFEKKYHGFWLGFNKRSKIDAATALYRYLYIYKETAVKDFVANPTLLKALKQGRLGGIAKNSLDALEDAIKQSLNNTGLQRSPLNN